MQVIILQYWINWSTLYIVRCRRLSVECNFINSTNNEKPTLELRSVINHQMQMHWNRATIIQWVTSKFEYVNSDSSINLRLMNKENNWYSQNIFKHFIDESYFSLQNKTEITILFFYILIRTYNLDSIDSCSWNKLIGVLFSKNIEDS